MTSVFYRLLTYLLFYLNLVSARHVYQSVTLPSFAGTATHQASLKYVPLPKKIPKYRGRYDMLNDTFPELRFPKRTCFDETRHGIVKMNDYVPRARYLQSSKWYWDAGDKEACLRIPDSDYFLIRLSLDSWGRIPYQFPSGFCLPAACAEGD